MKMKTHLEPGVVVTLPLPVSPDVGFTSPLVLILFSFLFLPFFFVSFSLSFISSRLSSFSPDSDPGFFGLVRFALIFLLLLSCPCFPFFWIFVLSRFPHFLPDPDLILVLILFPFFFWFCCSSICISWVTFAVAWSFVSVWMK